MFFPKYVTALITFYIFVTKPCEFSSYKKKQRLPTLWLCDFTYKQKGSLSEGYGGSIK